MKKEYLKANSILFLTQIGYGLTTALLSVYLAERGIGLANIGIIFAVGAMLAGLFRVPIGYIVDCLGRKRFIILGAIGYPIFSAGLIFANSVQHYTLLNLMVEFFGAVFWTAFSAYFFDIMAKGKEGLALSGRNITLYSASIFAPILAGILATHFSFAKLFLIGAAISVSAILLALTVKDHNHHKKMCYTTLEQEYKYIFNIKGMGVIILIIFIGDFIFAFWSIFMPIWLQQQGISLEAIGTILSVNMLVGAILQIPMGKAIDKSPARNILIPGFILFWIGGVLFFTFKNYFSYLVGRIMIGSSSDASYWPAVGMLAKITPKAEHGVAVALIFGLSAIMRGAGYAIGGVLSSAFGIEFVLVNIGFVALAAAILIIPSKLLRKKGTQFHKLHHVRALANRHNHHR